MSKFECFPNKLNPSNKIQVISPSLSLKLISKNVRTIAEKRLNDLGYEVSYSKNSEQCNERYVSSIGDRINDIHYAFEDHSVNAIMTAIGGFDVNCLLDEIDYGLIQKNPKILCGYSDITALSNAIYTRTGLVTYSGPHFSTWGMLYGFDYIESYWKKCLTTNDEYEILASNEWSDDEWYLNQEKRKFLKNNGMYILNYINNEEINGVIVGGNLSSLAALFGTEYMPPLKDKILFIEFCLDDRDVLEFKRNIASLSQQNDFSNLKAILIGRFQSASKITPKELIEMILSIKKYRDIPIIANLDFGHTFPMITFPIGGEALVQIDKDSSSAKIVIKNH